MISKAQPVEISQTKLPSNFTHSHCVPRVSCDFWSSFASTTTTLFCHACVSANQALMWNDLHITAFRYVYNLDAYSYLHLCGSSCKKKQEITRCWLKMLTLLEYLSVLMPLEHSYLKTVLFFLIASNSLVNAISRTRRSMCLA